MLKSSFGFFFIIIIATSVFIPIEIPYGFNTTAKVFPLQRWVLQKGTNGLLVSSLHDFSLGMMKDYNSYEFDRGDVINVSFNPGLKKKIEAGQPIASINSNMLGEQLVGLESQLMVEKANLKNVLAGEKIQLVDMVSDELSLAMEQVRIESEFVELQVKNFNRNKQLYDGGVISLAELEVHENALEQAKIEVDVAKRKVEVAKSNIVVNETGQKPEEIHLIETKIAALEKQMVFLENKNSNFAINAPISGKLTFESDLNGDRLIIEDTSKHILLIPIKIKDREYINAETAIDIKLAGVDSLIRADLIEVGSKIELLHSDLIVFAKASVTGNVGFINSGMPVRCKINCGKVTPLDYLKRSISIDIK